MHIATDEEETKIPGMDLKAFGTELKRLRRAARLSQEELVGALDQLGQAGHATDYRVIDGSLLSRWERAHAHQGRHWKPTRQYLLYLIQLLVNPLELARAQQWGSYLEYQFDLVELQALFGPLTSAPAALDTVTSATALTAVAHDPAAIRSRLEPRSDQQLFGVIAAHTRLQALLETVAEPWIIALDGLGGIGKTTLATNLAHDFVGSTRFANLAWVSAKQEAFQPVAGRQATGRAALDADGLTDALLSQLLPQTPLTTPRPEKHAALLRYLKAQPCLVVVDNLETVTDYAALLPALRQLANPSKFLITTRFSLRTEEGVFAYTLRELSESDVLDFLRYTAMTRNIGPLLAATPEQLSAIYHVAGGNPLALKLVIGQTLCLPLTQVLTNLVEARGQRVDALYTYIYWQAWQLLTPVERQLFVTLPLAPNGDFIQVALVSGLAEELLQDALARLAELSLVQRAGDLAEPRYRLHRLTETFLMNEVLKWQSMA